MIPGTSVTPGFCLSKPVMSDEKRKESEPLALVAAALLGGFVLGQARSKRTPIGTLLSVGCLAYALGPAVERAIVRAGARRGAVTLRTTIEVARPIHDTFDFFKDFENLPRIIGALRSVRDYQDGRSHWEAYGPSGSTLEWDALTTKYVPQSVIGWASVPGSPVESRGLLRFFGTPEGGTRVSIEFTFVPRTPTPLGDAVTSLLAPARQSLVSADLARAHFYLESLPRASDESSA